MRRKHEIVLPIHIYISLANSNQFDYVNQCFERCNCHGDHYRFHVFREMRAHAHTHNDVGILIDVLSSAQCHVRNFTFISCSTSKESAQNTVNWFIHIVLLICCESHCRAIYYKLNDKNPNRVCRWCTLYTSNANFAIYHQFDSFHIHKRNMAWRSTMRWTATTPNWRKTAFVFCGATVRKKKTTNNGTTDAPNWSGAPPNSSFISIALHFFRYKLTTDQQKVHQFNLSFRVDNNRQ